MIPRFLKDSDHIGVAILRSIARMERVDLKPSMGFNEVLVFDEFRSGIEFVPDGLYLCPKIVIIHENQNVAIIIFCSFSSLEFAVRV